MEPFLAARCAGEQIMCVIVIIITIIIIIDGGSVRLQPLMTLSSPTSSNLQFSMACVWLAAIRDGVVIIGVVLRYSPRHSSSAIMHSSRVSASSVATCI